MCKRYRRGGLRVTEVERYNAKKKGHPDLSARGSIISILHKYTSIIGFS
jgi:hypothetical protein